MTKQRITLISLVGLLIFGLLLGGKVIYQKQWVDATRLHQSQQIPGVVSVKTISNNSQQALVVVTKHMTNLRQSSLSLEKIAGQLPIQYQDQRNDQLETLFDQMQFALQEGIVRGNFTEMEQTVKAQAEKAGVQMEMEMDSDAIYVTLNQGESQLLEVIERHGQGQFLASEKE